MKTIAAVLVETGRPLVLADLEVPALKPGQVLVEVAYSGVCYSQVLEWRGYRGKDRYLPHCLGHEGSGIVRDVGAGVTKVKTGKPVVLSWIKSAGADVTGTTYRWEGGLVNAGPITTFSRLTVISENRLVALSDNLPLYHAALLGCAIPTGVGAVLNTAQPKAGQSIAIFGTGGVGLCAVAGAAVAGCVPIIAIDLREEKLRLARAMGATHCIQAGDCDPIREIQHICPDGVDFAIEATGRPPVMRQSLASVRPQGGTTVVIGNARYGEQVELDPREFNLGKRLLGTWGGDNCPDRDYPRYGRLIASNKLRIDSLLSCNYSLHEVNSALQDLEGSTVARPLIKMSAE